MSTPDPHYRQQTSKAIAAALAVGRREDVYLIVRCQEKRESSVVVTNGRTEHVGVTRLEGLGIQAFTRAGHVGFSAADGLDDAAAVAEAAVRLARLAEQRALTPNTEIFDVPPLLADEAPVPEHPMAIAEQEARLLELNASARARDERLSVRTSLRQIAEHWHIARSDGTDCYFQTRRAQLAHELTAKAGGKASTVLSRVTGLDAGLLSDATELDRLERRTARLTSLAIRLLGAPAVGAGSYKLVIDYALAKGLAHEAFGHAAETDAMETSILGTGGQFRRGEQVAPAFVSILDGPVPGDWADQPISANGELRETITIVRDGLLDQALADTFSARKAGVAPTGAARVQNYACLPMPRMTNTRIAVVDPLPLDVDFDDVTPEHVRDLLLERGLMAPGEHVLFLMGYKGGQVNTTLGDFVFNCAAIVDLSDMTLYQPAIFSGKVLSVLGAIRAGIGEPIIDAPGMCGKSGQSVPSSGGCHAFLVIDAHPDVRVGGKA